MKSTRNARYRLTRAFVLAITTAAAMPAWGNETTPGSALFSNSDALAFGNAVSEDRLSEERGGEKYVQISEVIPSGTVHDNLTSDVATGNNIIRDGSFTSNFGIPTSIQNTGNNVLIQNSTNLNLTLH